MRDSTLLLLAGAVPLAVEVLITALSAIYPHILMVTGPTINPTPTLLFFIWVPLYFYCPLVTPFICLMYLFALNKKSLDVQTPVLRILMWLGYISVALAYAVVILEFMRPVLENMMLLFVPPGIVVTYVFLLGRFSETRITQANAHIMISNAKEPTS